MNYSLMVKHPNDFKCVFKKLCNMNIQIVDKQSNTSEESMISKGILLFSFLFRVKITLRKRLMAVTPDVLPVVCQYRLCIVGC